ncbi:hypothetical protein D9758_012144 [Tetrapyrgos nigripes]|uniref:Meiotically up-regulated gene 152 protein n=1 Tax=Tetrapyrgos nigripes TaxID=182062 RepID=A0A8H5CN46_9AGAR|nr:hypothetical protein D9758_012144 [Tetrapyrgos nigripes]
MSQTGDASPTKEHTKFHLPSSLTFSFKAPFPASSAASSPSAVPLKQRRVSLALPNSPRQVEAWSFRDDTGLASVLPSNSSEVCLVPEKSGKLRRIAPDEDDEDLGGLQEKKQRKKWTPEETQMLVDGCNKHGVGNWKVILSDPAFKFDGRSPVDLKDRFRTYFPDAYKQHYPNARTHLSSKVRSTLPDGTSLFEKTRSKKRRPFTEEEDRALKAGYEKHGTVWATIVKDPIFQEQKRRSTDLRDRFRNAFPGLYQAAGYKPRNTKKKLGSVDLPGPSTSAGKMPIRAATDDQLSMTTQGTVRRRRRNTSSGLLRGGTKSVPQSAAASEDEDSSEDEVGSSKPCTPPFSSVWTKPPPSSASPPELAPSRSTSTMDDDAEMSLVDASMSLQDFIGNTSSELDAHSQTWSSGLDTPVHSHAPWAASPTSSHVSTDYLINSPFQGRNEGIVGGMGMIGKSAWGTQDWFSANPRLDNSGTSTSSYLDGLSPSSPFSFNNLNHGVFDRYDLVPGSNFSHSEVGTADSWSTFSDEMFPPTHSNYAGDLIAGARTHQPQTDYWGGIGRGLASLGEENGLGLVGMGPPVLQQSTGIHPMDLHGPALPAAEEIELTGMRLDDRQQSEQRHMDDSSVDIGIVDLSSPRESEHHRSMQRGNHHNHRDFQNREYSHQRSQSVMSDTRFSLDDLVDFSNEAHSTPPGTPYSQPRPLRKIVRSGSDASVLGHHGSSSHGRSISVPPSERVAPAGQPGSPSPSGPSTPPGRHMRSPSVHQDMLGQMRPLDLSTALFGGQQLPHMRQEQQNVSSTTPATVLSPTLTHPGQPTFSSLFLASMAGQNSNGNDAVTSGASTTINPNQTSIGTSQPTSEFYEIPFLDLHYYGGSGANGSAMFPAPTPLDEAQNSRQALDLAQSAVSSSYKSSGIVHSAITSGQVPLTPSLSRREANVHPAAELSAGVIGAMGDVLSSLEKTQSRTLVSGMVTPSVAVSALSLSIRGVGASSSHVNHHRGQSAASVNPQDLMLRSDNHKRKRASWDGAHM